MSDVGRIQGPSGPPDSSRPGRAIKKSDSGRFKEEMQRIEEVGKVDPDEAKKRKRPEETVREEELIRKAGSEPEKTNERTGKEFKISGKGAETTLGKTIFSEATPSMEQDISPEETLPAKKDIEKEKSTPFEKTLSHESALHQFVSEVENRSGMTHIIKSREAEIEQGATMPAAPETPEEEKKKAAAKGAEVVQVAAPAEASGIQPAIVEEPSPQEEGFLSQEPPPPYTHLHPDILDLFERVIGALVYLDQAGIKETTITIASSKEKTSIFNGAQITIREYSTAPKEFNIELKGDPKAVELFQSNKKDLMDAFDLMPYTFKVKNIETSLQ